jgi:hypothetical protein
MPEAASSSPVHPANLLEPRGQIVFRGSYSDRLAKLARRGHLGWPAVTIAFYGPDDTRASKLVVSVLWRADQDASEDDIDLPAPEEELIDQQKWFSDTADLREDDKLARDVLRLIEKHNARTVAMPEVIIGCPHEEGTDYPVGQACPQCPFWVGRDRFAGVLGHADDE